LFLLLNTAKHTLNDSLFVELSEEFHAQSDLFQILWWI